MIFIDFVVSPLENQDDIKSFSFRSYFKCVDANIQGLNDFSYFLFWFISQNHADVFFVAY